MSRLLAITTIVFALSSVWADRLHAETPSYFRLDGGVASGDERPLPDGFDSKGSLQWKRELPPGNSTPCIFGDRIYLTTHHDKELATVALDRASGKVLWKQLAPAKKLESFHPVGSPASCSPACDGKRVYAFFGSFGLLCYDVDVKLLWSKPMGPFQDEFGASSSPVLIDGKIILNEDHDVDSFLIAVDQHTGKTVWRTARDGFTRSYSTPVVWDINGTQQIVVAGALQLAAYGVKDGKKLWWVNGLSRIVDTTPVMANGLLYVASWTPGGDESERISMELFSEAAKNFDKNGDGKIAKGELPAGPVLTRFFRIDLNQDGALDEGEWKKHARVFELAENVVMAVKPGGKGNVTDSHVVWRYRRGLPTVPSPLVYRGMVYMVKSSGIVTSLDASNGRVLKQGRTAGRGNYYASLVAGDGKVYLASERGVVTVLQAGREWDTVSSHDFGERIMATPVLHAGSIYLRTDAALYCFK